MAEEDSMVNVEINEDGKTLSCKGENEMEETFVAGEAVMLTSRLTEEDFLGFISAITSQEVKLMLVCGTHASVGLDRLRSRQCVLHKQPDEKREGEDGEDQGNTASPHEALSLDCCEIRKIDSSGKQQLISDVDIKLKNVTIIHLTLLNEHFYQGY